MPGKFNSVNDEAIYNLTLGGTGESVGSVQDVGHFTRITFDESFDYEVPFTSITRVHAGTYIVMETPSGYVQVTGYATHDDGDQRLLEARWETILEDVARYDGEDTEDEL